MLLIPFPSSSGDLHKTRQLGSPSGEKAGEDVQPLCQCCGLVNSLGSFCLMPFSSTTQFVQHLAACRPYS